MGVTNSIQFENIIKRARKVVVKVVVKVEIVVENVLERVAK